MGIKIAEITKGINKYYRVVINSSNGEKAWTQPILL